MEISASSPSFSFLTPEDYSHFHSLLFDMEPFNFINSCKRRRVHELVGLEQEQVQEGRASSSSSLTDNEFLSLDGHYNQDLKWVFDYPPARPLPDSDHQMLAFAQAGPDDAKRNTHKRDRLLAQLPPALDQCSGGEKLEKSGPNGSTRRLWVKDRSKDWWDRCNRPDFPEEEFRKAFRMSRATFDMVCEELDSAVTKKNTALRDAIPVRQRVAVCLWRLATGEPLRVVSNRFGLGISTCHKVVLEVCTAIKNVLMPKFLRWPDDPLELGSVMCEFESLSSGIPNVCGSMYTTHVPIIAPKTGVAEYYNKRHTERNHKPSYSITIQGVVDHRGVFTDICVGWPGSMPDDRVLEKSALYQRANKGQLRDVRVVGQSGHPLMDWVLVPYSQKNLTWAQHTFNEKVGDVQAIAKEAFAKLKRRWGCLQKRTEVKLQELPVVLGACCILHNVCEMRGEVMSDGGDGGDNGQRFELFDDEMAAESNIAGSWSATAMHARDRIAHHLLHHGAGSGGDTCL